MDIYTTMYCIPFRPRTFNIFPEKTFHPRIQNLLEFITPDIRQQIEYLKGMDTNPLEVLGGYKIREPDPFQRLWSVEIVEALRKAVAFIRCMRLRLRKFLHLLRYRRLRQLNTEDAITLERPQNKIEIVDWSIRSKYIYEAYSLMKDINSRLMNHDGVFDMPQEPRNCFTNISLTQSQTISVWNQLSICGIPASSVFTAFRQCKYSMHKFKIEYAIPLQLNAFRKTMMDTNHYDYKERLMDFIANAYAQEDMVCYTNVYKYVMDIHPTHSILKEWARLCTQYYEICILYGKNTNTLQTLHDSILDSTVPLLNKQIELRIFCKMGYESI